MSALRLTWEQVAARSGTGDGKTFCADCRLCFDDAGIPCFSHTLPSESEARGRIAAERIDAKLTEITRIVPRVPMSTEPVPAFDETPLLAAARAHDGIAFAEQFSAYVAHYPQHWRALLWSLAAFQDGATRAFIMRHIAPEVRA